MQIYEDDILETALNSGLEFTAKKFNIEISTVREIVMKFKEEVETDPTNPEGLCVCEKAGRKGIAMFCWMCAGPEKLADRIRI